MGIVAVAAVTFTSTVPFRSGLTFMTVANLIGDEITISPNWQSMNKFLTGLVWENLFNLIILLIALVGGLVLLLLIWLVPNLRRIIGVEKRWLYAMMGGPIPTN